MCRFSYIKTNFKSCLFSLFSKLPARGHHSLLNFSLDFPSWLGHGYFQSRQRRWIHTEWARRPNSANGKLSGHEFMCLSGIQTVLRERINRDSPYKIFKA